jgi:hypothetical protein
LTSNKTGSALKLRGSNIEAKRLEFESSRLDIEAKRLEFEPPRLDVEDKS